MLKQCVISLLLASCCVFLSVGSGYSAAETLELNDHSNQIIISSPFLKWLEDPHDTYTINGITAIRDSAFKPIESDIINLGHTASSIWATFEVTNNTGNENFDDIWMLEIGFPLLKRVNIYVTDNQKVLQKFQIGYEHNINSRLIPTRNFVQPIRLDYGKTYQVYVNVMRKNGSVQLPLKIYKPTSFLLSEVKANYVFGIFFGILLAMVVYNTYLYLSVRNKAYLYYILYIICAIGAFLTTTGYGFLFLWSDTPLINEYALQIPSTIGAITGLLFFRHFIRVKQYYRYIDTFISLMVALGAFLMLLRLATDFFLSETITIYVGFISVSLPFMAYQCWAKGSRSAGFFLLGWGALFVGIFLYTASLMGVLPVNGITTNGVLVGAALETLLLSLGLADRINAERKAKYKALQAQHEAVIQLTETENQLVHRALHSGVTGLPNRAFLKTTLDELISKNESNGFFIVLISLNNFHEINKTLGHSNGDTVLYLATQRINTLCENISHIVSFEKHSTGQHYLAGVEGITFAFVVREGGLERAKTTVLNMLRELEKPLMYQGLSLDIDNSAAIAICPDHGENSETLIRNAHIALETASLKNEKLAVYSQDVDPYNERRISLIGELRQAIKNDELQLYFQPQVSLDSNQVGGAEVLIRWIHPEYGFIPPDEFIPLAEKTGVIHSLTYWICENAFKFKSDLAAKGFEIDLSINISARNLQDPEFKRRVCLLAQEQSVSLDHIVMELTETAIMTDPNQAMHVMNSLNEAGIRLSIDDFGTGYSSLSYLKKLPVDELKIDRSFVMEMANNSEDQLLVKTTLSMGHNLSMKVVAEGIEDETTLQLLKEMGCDLAQGYHIARPMPGEDFCEWINQYSLDNPIMVAM